MSSANKTPQSVAHPLGAPDITVNARDVFGLDIDMEIPAFSEASDYVPAVDSSYQFDHDTTLAILALYPGQPRQPYQPNRSDRQGCDCVA